MAGYFRSLGKALGRSVDVVKESAATAMRMEVAPNSRTQGALPLWTFQASSPSTSAAVLEQFATGSDADIGGLSQAKLALDQEGCGRFFGTITNEVPRNGRIERSGYAAFRNRSRPTLFGQQTWDTTLHPYLSLRVRNRLAGDSRTGSPTPSLSSLLAGSNASAQAKANRALGLNDTSLGPKFFVNIQTDGPVTSDLFQHRLWFDEAKGDQWQTVLIPFDDFVLTNTGQVAPSQITMMREKLRTIGISVVIESPVAAGQSQQQQQQQQSSPSSPSSTPSALKKDTPSHVAEGAEDWAVDGSFKEDGNETGAIQRGSKRERRFNFDLGIQGAWAVGEEALGEGGEEAFKRRGEGKDEWL